MARTAEEGFREFLKALTPSTLESQGAKGHRASIEQCLKANFGLNRFARIGSFGNGTSISGHSDVDYIAVLPTNQLKANSDASLSRVREVLGQRFPNTGVRVDCPAVVCPFGGTAADTTEVVPADYVKDDNGYKVYEIADSDGGWMRASPDAHNAYVKYVDTKLANRVKPLIRFIKAWKYYRHVPISSFYLELRVAAFASAETNIVYPFDVRNALKALSDCNLARMQDPMGVSGYIEPCSSEAKREDALSKLSTALARSQKALDAYRSDDFEEAFDWWQMLWNDQFPSWRG